MTGKEALRRLRQAGWSVLRNGKKHLIMIKDGHQVVVSKGGRDFSPRQERGVWRLLDGRPTRSESLTRERQRG